MKRIAIISASILSCLLLLLLVLAWTTQPALHEPKLVSVSADEGDFPRAILDALAAMGPAAADAIERLRRLRARFANSGTLPDLGAAEPDQYEDPVGWALKKIGG